MSNERISHEIAAGGDDERSLREHGRQLAIDSLLEMAFAGRGGLAVRPSRPTRRFRAWALPAAVAATVLLACGGYVAVRWIGPAGPGPQVVGPFAPEPILAAGWRVEPTGNADYRVLGPTAIRLDRGELYVESTAGGDPAGPLTIETRAGMATAQGARFYVGCHADTGEQERPMTTRRTTTMTDTTRTKTMLTRVLVLAGMVTLANVHGETTGKAEDLLVTKAGAAPERHAVAANADFALDLYGQLAKENDGKNLFFSPYSMSNALAMTVEGARGQTADEMGKVLRFPEAAKRLGDDAQLLPWNTGLIHTGMAALNDRFQSKADTPYEISVANALYGEQTYPFSPDYVATIGKFYGTGAVVPVDFKNLAEAARLQINAWAEEKTRGRIKDLVPQGAVGGLTRLVLLNAIYFKADWATEFDVKATREQDFHVGAGRKQAVAMMHKDGLKGGRYGAFNADGSRFTTPREVTHDAKPDTLYPGLGGFQIAELPYKGKELSMVLVVPQDLDGLAAVEKQLTAETVAAWLGAIEAREMHVAMPKFRLETDYKMKPTLEALGMSQAFDSEKATLDGMVTAGSAGLFISGVIHKAFVEVTEKGTEAAAATAVFGIFGAAPRTRPFTPTIRADRPFLFAIRDVQTGTILFLGRFIDPTGTAAPAAGQ
jgi:serine protease inhibitor